MSSYFSDREREPRPRTREDIPENVWGGIITLVQSRMADGSFGSTYPERCPDNASWICGCDEYSFGRAVEAELPDLAWPLRLDQQPDVPTVLDLIEFCYRGVTKPDHVDWHSYYGHPHLQFDAQQGRVEFSADINRIFSRNGIAFSLDGDGKVRRIGPPILTSTLLGASFRTGDGHLDELLETARQRLIDPDLAVRKESLEKLWDAWERLKTLEPGKDKKASIKALLDQVTSEPTFRQLLEEDANALTKVGNAFMIRHTETGKVPIADSASVDYLFHRLFALIWLALVATNRT